MIQPHFHIHALNEVIMFWFLFVHLFFVTEQRNVHGWRNDLSRKLTEHLEIASVIHVTLATD